MVCPHCGYHFRLDAAKRIEFVCDPDSFVELNMNEDVPEEHKHLPDGAIRGGMGEIKGRKCVLGVMDFSFKGGTMGAHVGQYIIRLMNKAREYHIPFIIFCASGGVRIQEGIWGLFQMIRTVNARNMTKDVPMITVFTDPTTGGVSASFAALADILLAEPGARIGFAGPRVIESTIKCTPPPNFQNAEKLLSNGFLDRIVPRKNLRETLSFILRWF